MALDAARDAGAVEFLTAIERERRIGSTHAMTDLQDRFGLPNGLSLEKAVDICWTPDAFQAWLARQLQASLLPHDA